MQNGIHRLPFLTLEKNLVRNLDIFILVVFLPRLHIFVYNLNQDKKKIVLKQVETNSF